MFNKLRIKGVNTKVALPEQLVLKSADLDPYGNIGTTTGYISVKWWNGETEIFGRGDSWSEENGNSTWFRPGNGGFYENIPEEVEFLNGMYAEFASQGVEFWQNNTDGNGGWLNLRAQFDSLGNVESYTISGGGEGHKVGDTITLNNNYNPTLQIQIRVSKMSPILDKFVIIRSCNQDGKPSGNILSVEVPEGYLDIDVSKLSKLEKLSMNGVNLESLNVSNLPNLKNFYIYSSTFNSYTFSNLPKIEDLFIEKCPLSSFEVTNLPSLKRLGLGGNNITSLDLTTFTNLKELYLPYSQINLSSIIPNSGLSYLSLYNSGITSISSQDLSNFTNLVSLDLSENPIESYDFTSLTNLERLYLYRTGITSTIGFPSTLKRLDLSSNKITSLNLSNFTQLEWLWVGENDLVDFESLVGLSTALKLLGISLNKLTSIDISTYVNLETLYINDNKLETIDLTGLTNLKEIDLGRNLLTSTSSDFILNTLSDTTTKTDGWIAAPFQKRTSASDSAFNSLISRGWSIDVQPLPDGKITFNSVKNPGETILAYFASPTGWIKATYWDGTTEVTQNSIQKLIDVNDTYITRTVEIEICNESGDLQAGNFQSIEMEGNETDSLDISELNYLQGLYLTYNPLTSEAQDNILISLSNMLYTNGYLRMPLMLRTSASDAAYAKLQEKGWYFESTGINDGSLTFTTYANPGEQIGLYFGVTSFTKRNGWSSQSEAVLVKFWDGTEQIANNTWIYKTIDENDTYEERTIEVFGAIYGYDGTSWNWMKSDVCVFRSINLPDAKVKNIDVSNFVNLTYLVLGNSQISSIDLSKLAKLEILGLSNTPITSLDISQTKVYMLNCENASLTYLNVWGNEYIQQLNILGTNLSASDVDGIIGWLDRPTHKANNGFLWAVSRTTASNSDYNSLISKGWTINISQIV